MYTVNYYASPNTNFTPALNLVINGSTIPNPNIAAASIVIALTAANNSLALQATSSWTPFADLVSNGILIMLLLLLLPLTKLETVRGKDERQTEKK